VLPSPREPTAESVDGWSLEDLDRAASPESLSLAADDYRQSMGAARKWIGAPRHRMDQAIQGCK
jgi:hypothetical protein